METGEGALRKYGRFYRIVPGKSSVVNYTAVVKVLISTFLNAEFKTNFSPGIFPSGFYIQVCSPIRSNTHTLRVI